MTSKEPYKLSLQLEGHSADVRSVTALESAGVHDPLLLSGSRDGTARVWGKPPGSRSKRDLACRYTLEGQAGFVNSCAWADIDGQILALAGGQDHLVNAYVIPPGGATAETSASTPLTPEYTLVGHSDNVCALDTFAAGSDGYIVSGSWDKTAKVWRNFECVATLNGHEQAVWAVLALDHDHVLTGEKRVKTHDAYVSQDSPSDGNALPAASADKLVRLYSISKAAREGDKSTPIAIYTGNTDAVRGLARLNERSFASCGNDGNIHVYPLQLPATSESPPITPIQTLSGHTSFVYSLASLGNGGLASAGEDRSVRVWKAGQLQQTITIPAVSVWSVTAMPNGDVACGSSDGFVRVFTRVPQRLADPDVLQAFDATVSSQSLNKAQVGDIQKENLPGAEALSTPGKEGQVKMIRIGDVVEAHQFSASSGGWQKVGEVVGGVGSSQKKLHEGKEYDYVFDVDIAEGAPPLKLPYNASENPFVTAQRFLEKNELPLTYLDQVVGFIEKNTGAVSLGGGDFVDPYTGASSYRPGGTNGPAPVSRPPVSQPPTPASLPAMPTKRILPVRQALTFKQFNPQGARLKIEELNASVAGSAALTAEQMEEILSLVEQLSGLATNKDAALPTARIKLLQDSMMRWPLAQRFPLLDAFRVACLSSTIDAGNGVGVALQAANWSVEAETDDKARTTAFLLALRASANAIARASADSMISILAEVASGASNLTPTALIKPARTAYATVLLNISVLVSESKQHSAGAPQLLRLISGALELESNITAAERDGEAAYRGAIALGNLCTSPFFGSLSLGGFQTALQSGQACARTLPEARLDTLLREIESRSGVL